jgi:hypothetical protein
MLYLALGNMIFLSTEYMKYVNNMYRLYFMHYIILGIASNFEKIKNQQEESKERNEKAW